MEKCIECGEKATEKHHVIPRSKGGTGTIPLCGSCHMKAHNIKSSQRMELPNLIRDGIEASKAKWGEDQDWLDKNTDKIMDVFDSLMDSDYDKAEFLSYITPIVSPSFIRELVETGTASEKVTITISI